MNRKKLLWRISGRTLNNVRFADMIDLVKGFGFNLVRVSGSHHIYSHPAVPELLNLQEVNGEAKPYQIRQFIRMIDRYNLRLEDE